MIGHVSAHQITPLQIHALHDAWKKRLSANTLNQYTGELRRLFTSLQSLSGCTDLLPHIPKTNKARPRQNIALAGEVDRLLAAAPRWLQAIILLAHDAGLRRSDAMAFALANYDADTKTIRITQKKTKRPIAVPASPRLAEHIESAPTYDPAMPLYKLWRDGKPITNSGLSIAWHRLKQATGVTRNLWLHDLRRTLAVKAYDATHDLRTVQQLLGHENLLSTAVYLEHRDPDKLRAVIDAMHQPRRKGEPLQ